MKLKKIISLTLVFAMMFTMFAALTVSAADTAKLSFVAYSDGKVVEGNLEAGKTYEISLLFTEISSKSFKGAEVKMSFDPTVLQLVKSTGDEPTAAGQTVVTTVEMYNAEEGTGIFSTSPSSYSNTEGYIKYGYSVAPDVAQTYPSGVSNDGTHEFCRVRVKALKNGAANIDVAAEDVSFYPTADKGEVTIIPSSIRVGDMSYVSAVAEDVAPVTVLAGTTAEDIIDELAETVKVTYTDEEGGTVDKTCAITWTAQPDFNADKADTYIFEGAVATPDDITYTGEAVKVGATVTVNKLTVESVDAIADVICRVNGTVELPETVTVTVNEGKKEELAVTWEPSAFDTSVAATFDCVGTIASNDKVDANGKTAALKVVVIEVPEGKESVTFDNTTYKVEVDTNDGYTLSDAKDDAEFAGKYADGTALDLSEIVWDADSEPSFDGETEGKYTLKGVWSDEYANSQELTIEITVESAGATGIKIKSSKTAVNSLSSITMSTLDAKTVYAVLEPADCEDTITWKIDKTSYATVSAASDTSATIKTKSVAGTCTLTATTSSGVSASVKIIVNASSSNNNSGVSGSIYKGGSASNLLASEAEKDAQQEIAGSSAFTDIGGYEWAATQIETLRLLGIVSGRTASTFAPAESVTRAEFLAMLVRLLNLQANGTAKTFTDVPSSAWYYETVNIASSLGIAYGYENGAFDPNAVITRQDMAVFAERAMNAANLSPVVGLERTFSDQGDISSYALSSVLRMTAVGAINGMEDGSFRPAETANRAQAAVVVYNLYAIKNK